MMDQRPMNLFDCLGVEMASALIIASQAIVILYFMIAFYRFLPAARASSTLQGRVIWYSIAIIFPFCAVAGYQTTVLSGWFPGVSYPLKLAAAIFDIVFCVMFLAATRNHHLAAISNDAWIDLASRALEHNIDNPAEQIREIRQIIEETQRG